MRVTNQMMINSSMANIQVNKKQISRMDEQLSSEKKINKPSEDPVIAIRALRLRSSLNEVTQYLKRNIPDAQQWLDTTRGAVDEAGTVIDKMYEYCVQGSTDSYSTEQRQTLADSLNALKTTFYEEANVDYAGRYVFSGYRTDTTVTYQSDEEAKNQDFTITQKFGMNDLSEKIAYTGTYSNDDIIDFMNTIQYDADGNAEMPNKESVHRVMLGYTNVSAGGVSVKIDGADVAATTTTDPNAIPGADEVIVNTTTGEVLLGENVYSEIYTGKELEVTYDKKYDANDKNQAFKKGDLNPTMYFTCVDNNTGIVYEKEDQNIEYNINYAQKIKINTEASEVFDVQFGRDVDDLVTSVNNVLDIESQMQTVQNMMKEERYSDELSQKKLNTMLKGLEKQHDLAKENMKDTFEKGVGKMQKYQQSVSLANADIGNRLTRLELSEDRLTEQHTNVTKNKSTNEDIDLEEVVINYTSSQLVYDAALQSASKIVQKSLLDFLG